MTHPLARQDEIEREARRRRIAALVLAGVRDQSKIAEQVGVSRVTVGRDIKALEVEWQKTAAQDIAAAKGVDLDRTERLISALWADAIKGKWLATDRIIALMQHRAKLLGLNAPEKREDTYRIEVRAMVQRIAEETGLDESEVLAEAERIVSMASAG
jgi:transposase